MTPNETWHSKMTSAGVEQSNLLRSMTKMPIMDVLFADMSLEDMCVVGRLCNAKSVDQIRQAASFLIKQLRLRNLWDNLRSRRFSFPKALLKAVSADGVRPMYCSTCEMWLPSSLGMADHLNGKKHTKNRRKLCLNVT